MPLGGHYSPLYSIDESYPTLYLGIIPLREWSLSCL
jgi:hypothetical protein